MRKRVVEYKILIKKKKILHCQKQNAIAMFDLLKKAYTQRPPTIDDHGTRRTPTFNSKPTCYTLLSPKLSYFDTYCIQKKLMKCDVEMELLFKTVIKMPHQLSGEKMTRSCTYEKQYSTIAGIKQSYVQCMFLLFKLIVNDRIYYKRLKGRDCI